MKFIYKKLKEERKKRNMIIKEVSELSGVSQGMISSIERGIVNPSVDVLLKICRTLELNLNHVLHLASSQGEIFVLRRQDQYTMEDERGRSFFASPVFQKGGHTVLVTYVNPNNEFGRKHISYDTNELIIVMAGKVLFHYGEEETVLEAGDSVYFSANQIHYVENLYDSIATLVWCVFK